MEEQVKSMQIQMDELKADLNNKFELLMSKLNERTSSSIVTTPKKAVEEHNNGGSKPLGFMPKLEFSKFDGTNPNEWIRKASKYFELCKIGEEQKVDLASLYMIDKAAVWVASFLAMKPMIGWMKFCLGVRSRFLDEPLQNVVENFNKLTQRDSLEEYFDAFECNRSFLEMHDYDLSDKFLLDSFISGLNDTLKPFVKAFKPDSITKAMEYARLQEESVKSLYNSTPKQSLKPFSLIPKSQNKPPLLPTPSDFHSYKFNPKQNYTNSTSNRPNRFVSTKVKAENIAQGLCYLCDKPYEKGHKCDFKEPQLFTIEVLGDADEEGNEYMDDEYSSLPVQEFDEPHISLHALTGEQAFHTMRVVGFVKHKPLHILIDSRSTHNFLDIEYAKKLGCVLEQITPQEVIVADGNKLACQYRCKNFVWMINGSTFVSDTLLIPIGSCDMVLGVQWLRTLGEISWNFREMIMKFKVKGKRLCLKGVPEKKLQVIEGTIKGKEAEQSMQFCLLQVCQPSNSSPSRLMNTLVEPENTLEPPEITLFRKEFEYVFEDPKELPPTSGVFDHKIPLEEGTKPINIRPYRYQF
ncbi:unnamed protein product [Amaranthus hypochondriacus]